MEVRVREESKGASKAIIGIIVVVLLVAATTGVIVWSSMEANKQATTDDTAQTSQQKSTSTKTDMGQTKMMSGEFKDGTYTASGTYQTPGGQESVGVKVTLADGVITDATVTQNATGGEAAEYQAAFVSGYKSQVVGKKISEVNLTRVAGSSLTPNGFNSAIDTIQSEAQA